MDCPVAIFGKNENELFDYFEELVKDNTLKAYTVRFNAQKLIEETDDYKIIRITKGAILKPAKAEMCYKFNFVKDNSTGRKYKLDIRSFDRNVSNDRSFRDLVHACDLERLAANFDPRKVSLEKRYLPDVFGESGPFNYLMIPEEMITARLKAEYVQHQIIDLHASFYSQQKTQRTSGKLEVSDETDPLFVKFVEFLKS